MTRYQTRKAILRRGTRKVEIEIGSGHVWERDNGTSAYPLWNPKQEQAQFARLLRKHKRAGFAVVKDTGLIPGTKVRRRR
jgi:hypothetical protein